MWSLVGPVSWPRARKAEQGGTGVCLNKAEDTVKFSITGAYSGITKTNSRFSGVLRFPWSFPFKGQIAKLLTLAPPFKLYSKCSCLFFLPWHSRPHTSWPQPTSQLPLPHPRSGHTIADSLLNASGPQVSPAPETSLLPFPSAQIFSMLRPPQHLLREAPSHWISGTSPSPALRFALLSLSFCCSQREGMAIS